MYFQSNIINLLPINTLFQFDSTLKVICLDKQCAVCFVSSLFLTVLFFLLCLTLRRMNFFIKGLAREIALLLICFISIQRRFRASPS